MDPNLFSVVSFHECAANHGAERVRTHDRCNVCWLKAITGNTLEKGFGGIGTEIAYWLLRFRARRLQCH